MVLWDKFAETHTASMALSDVEDAVTSMDSAWEELANALVQQQAGHGFRRGGLQDEFDHLYTAAKDFKEKLTAFRVKLDAKVEELQQEVDTLDDEES